MMVNKILLVAAIACLAARDAAAISDSASLTSAIKDRLGAPSQCGEGFFFQDVL
jgi:hypothetical protein